MTDRLPLRVLLVEEVGLGGITEYANALARALVKEGFVVHLATGRDHDAAGAPGVIVHRVFPYLRGRGALGRLARRLHLARPLNGLGHLGASFLVARLARRCDVVHLQGEEWPPLGALQALLLRASGRPLVYTPHNTFQRGARAYERSHRLIRRCAARIVIHSEWDRSALPPQQARKAVVIPHGEYSGLARRGGPDLDADAVRHELGLDGGELVVLLFGLLRRDKGVRDLLEAAAVVEDVHVILAGEDRGGLDDAADLLVDPRLRGRTLLIEGFLPDEQVSRVFAAADVVALPYPRASASGVLLLAYGYARPVVCYPVGGLPEYVRDGSTGWLCRSADAASLRDSLREVRAAGRAECRARGQSARRFADERLGWEVIAERTGDLYRELLGTGSRDGG